MLKLLKAKQFVFHFSFFLLVYLYRDLLGVSNNLLNVKKLKKISPLC